MAPEAGNVSGYDRLAFGRHVSGLKLGFLRALIAGANHAIVSTIELVFGMRLGADVDVSQLLANLGVAVGGNLVGGLMFVTFVRFVQAAEGAGA